MHGQDSGGQLLVKHFKRTANIGNAFNNRMGTGRFEGRIGRGQTFGLLAGIQLLPALQGESNAIACA